MTTLALLPAAVFTLTSCSSTAPPDVGTSKITYTKGVPGGVIVQTVKMTATVTAIDRKRPGERIWRRGGEWCRLGACEKTV